MKITDTTSFIQQAIVRVLVRDLLAAGFYIDVNDREETNLKRSRDHAAIMGAIFDPNIDEDRWTLDLWKNPKARNSDAWVLLVDGNGSTVISDYTTNIEAEMKNADALVNEIMSNEETWLIDNLFNHTSELQRAALDVVMCYGHPDAPGVSGWWEAHAPDYEDQPQTSNAVRSEMLAQLAKALRSLGVEVDA